MARPWASYRANKTRAQRNASKRHDLPHQFDPVTEKSVRRSLARRAVGKWDERSRR